MCLLGLAACWHQPAEKEQAPVPASGLRIAFYNTENLYDPYDDPAIDDEEFLPQGRKRWTADRYQQKLVHLAQVIAAMDYPALLGLAEVENAAVLHDLAGLPSLRDKGYRILHDESPDARGIDVALLYQPVFFTPFLEESLEVTLPRSDTREILKVGGTVGIEQDTLWLLINHWPSRSGGVARSAPYRAKAARVARTAVDHWLKTNPAANIMVMGDFNDEPTDASIAEILLARGTGYAEEASALYNPMHKLQQQGKGSYRYRHAWNMLDQIMLSAALADNSAGNLRIEPGSAQIFCPDWLLQPEGRYAGYPSRTFAGNTYLGGYSDHLPVLVELIK